MSASGRAGFRKRLLSGLAVVVMGSARTGVSLLPQALRRRLDDRFFRAVFNVTRVTNDAYGWRPPMGSGGSGVDTQDPYQPPASAASGGRVG